MTPAATQLMPRRLPGPFATRMCVDHAGRAVWVQRLRHPLPPEAAAALASTRRLVADTYVDVRTRVPHLGDPHTLMFPAVATPQLVFDALFDRNAPVAELTVVFARLGAFLADLHNEPGTQLPPTESRLIPRWYPADPQLVATLASIRDRLPISHDSTLGRWAREGRHLSNNGPSTVHGRFSSSWLAWDPSKPDDLDVLGWSQASCGDGLVDVAQLLSELAEAVAGGFVRPADACRLGRALLAPLPAAADGTRLRGLAARLIVDHFTLRAWTAGDSEPSALFCGAVDRALGQLIEDIVV